MLEWIHKKSRVYEALRRAQLDMWKTTTEFSLWLILNLFCVDEAIFVSFFVQFYHAKKILIYIFAFRLISISIHSDVIFLYIL